MKYRFIAPCIGICLTVVFAMHAPAAAQPAIVVNLNDGRVLYAEDADRLWHPASLTKLMTAYVTFEAIRDGLIGHSTPLLPTWRARVQPKVRYGLRRGRTMTVDDAIKAIIIRSANDVSFMLAEGVGSTLSRVTPLGDCIIDHNPRIPGAWSSGGPAGFAIDERIRNGHVHPPRPRYGYGAPKFEAVERRKRLCRHDAFIARMNQTAKRLGMTRTHFRNANGLPSRFQVTTARDMAILAHALVRDFPQHQHYFSIAEAKVGWKQLYTHNSILKTFEGGDGMKTGFVCASGYNLVATATRDGARIAAVVLGWMTSGWRNQRAKELLEFGFERHAWVSAVDGHDLVSYAPSGDLDARPGDIERYIRVCGGRVPRSARRAWARRGGQMRVSRRASRSDATPDRTASERSNANRAARKRRTRAPAKRRRTPARTKPATPQTTVASSYPDRNR